MPFCRELAFQIHEQFVALGTAINLKSTVVVGGLDMMQQASALADRPHVVVATPGRLCDLIKSSSGNGSQWNLSKVKYLVLDEADRLLNPTFAEELGFLIKQLPQQRQTLLFTATITDAIMHLREKEPAPAKQKPFLHLTDQEYVARSLVSFPQANAMLAEQPLRRLLSNSISSSPPKSGNATHTTCYCIYAS